MVFINFKMVFQKRVQWYNSVFIFYIDQISSFYHLSTIIAPAKREWHNLSINYNQNKTILLLHIFRVARNQRGVRINICHVDKYLTINLASMEKWEVIQNRMVGFICFEGNSLQRWPPKCSCVRHLNSPKTKTIRPGSLLLYSINW